MQKPQILTNEKGSWQKSDFNLLKNNFFLLRSDPICRLTLKISLFLTALGFLVLSLSWHRLPPEVPLLYSLPHGEQTLALSLFLWLLPAASFLVIVINVLLAQWFFLQEKFLSQIFCLTTTITSFLGTVTLIKIILLVTSWIF